MNRYLVKLYTSPLVDDPEERARDLGALVADRHEWARLVVAPSQREEGGWDVAVRVGGPYEDKVQAESALAELAERAAEVAYLNQVGGDEDD